VRGFRITPKGSITRIDPPEIGVESRRSLAVLGWSLVPWRLSHPVAWLCCSPNMVERSEVSSAATVAWNSSHARRDETSHSRGHVLMQFTIRRRSLGESEASDDSDESEPTSYCPLSAYATLTMLKMDAALFDRIRSFSLWTMIEALGDALVLISQTTRLPVETVYQLSVFLLCFQLILRDILEPFLCQLDRSSNPVEMAMELALREPASLIIYILPLLTTLFSFCISLTLLLQWQPMEAVVLSGLVSLLVVECLVPLSIAFCTFLYVGEFVSIESAALLLAMVWVTCTVCSRCIRVALYPSLGHG
jgi:hypothetical protein